MGETILTLTGYKCDVCGAKEEFKNESGEPPDAIKERWRSLLTFKPGPFPEEATGQAWLLCRPCYKRATEALAALTRRVEDGDG